MRERVLLTVLKWPVAIWMKSVFNAKVTRNDLDKKEGPVIFLGNHVTFEDSILAYLYTDRPISFLAAKINFDNPFKKVLFKFMKIVPFTKGKMDIKALKELKKLVDSGQSVGLYPEGGRTWDGSNIYIIESIANLIKLLKIPVYYVDLQGIYMVKPRWAKYYRRGRTKVEIKKVLTKEQVKQMNSDEILDTVKKVMEYDEYERQRTDKIEYKGKDLAESLEKVIFKCPNCMAVDSYTSKGNDFWCTECNKRYSMDKYGFIHGSDKFDNLHDWNNWQLEYIDEIYDNNMPFVSKNINLTIVEEKSRKKQKCDFTVDKGKVMLGDIEILAENISSPNIVFTNVVEFFVDEHKAKYRIKMHPKRHTSITLVERMLQKMIERSKQTK